MEKEKKTPKKKERHTGRNVAIGVVIALIIFLALINFLTDFLWFKELGYVSVFLKKLFTQLKIGIPVFIIMTMVVYVYFKFLKKSYFKHVFSEDPDRGKTINVTSWIMAAIFGGIVTYLAVTRLWFRSLEFFNSTDFGIKEALFNNDASFYVFKMEFLTTLVNMVLGVVLVLLVMTLIYYAILLSLHSPEKREKVTEEATGADFGDQDGFDQERQFEKEREAFRKKNASNPFEEILGKFTKGFDFSSFTSTKVKAPKPTGDIRGEAGRLFAIARTQLIIVAIIFFTAVAAHFFLNQYSLLYNHTGAVYGAGYTDIKVTLWMYRILIGLAIVGAAASVFCILRQKVKPVLTVPIIMIIVFAVGTAGAMVVQNFIVSPDEINKESKYLERNIKCTQYAYNLGDVDVKPFAANNKLTGEDIKKNEATISNIRINDYKPAKTFYNQTQSIRQYYTFNDVDVDRYDMDGEYTQTFLSSREIDESKISNTWINRHIKYTHGYGATMSRVDEITASGQPDMLVKDIPPESDVKNIQIKRPEIYFGESTNDYILVNTDESEFDYPDGDSNKYTKYKGTAGIKMNPVSRLMFAIRQHSLKLLVSSNVKADSRIVINRNITDRVRQIMPYLSYDSDPYMCTANGKLYWIIDAYTQSNKFPYSEPYDANRSSNNYIRNSVKVVIDAYNGTTDYYIVDETDAVAKTMQKIYPKLFKNMKEMPEGIRAHIRYPNTMFDIQAKVYQRYHMNDVKVFYQNEDMWAISNEIYGTEKKEMEPNYYILNLPGEKDAEFVNSIPYTPKDKDNMTGLLVAHNDGERYGKLVLYKLPKSRVVYGPAQIEAQIDQSTEISKEFSLWSQAGSSYSRGNMFVIPIEDSIMYVEPVYLEAKNSSIPEVKRVIVAYGDKIAYEPTLAEALNSMFGEGSGDNYKNDADKGNKSGGSGKALSQAQIIQKAQAAYEAALAAQKSGDWTEYGKQMEKLEELLKQLK